MCHVLKLKVVNTFPIDTVKDQLVGHLKKVIKAKKQNDFAGVNTNKFKLWKVEIFSDHVDPLSNLSLQNNNKLLAIKKILKYFSDLPSEDHIHVLVLSLE